MSKPQSSYAQKLRDPRWQKKRLEILQRDEFTCKNCQDKETTLHVHHCYYSADKSLNPWEYEDSSLVTLCENCHKDESDYLLDNQKLLSKTLGLYGLFGSDVQRIARIFYFLGDHDYMKDRKNFITVMEWAFLEANIFRFMGHLYREFLDGKLTEEP